MAATDNFAMTYQPMGTITKALGLPDLQRFPLVDGKHQMCQRVELSSGRTLQVVEAFSPGDFVEVTCENAQPVLRIHNFDSHRHRSLNLNIAAVESLILCMGKVSEMRSGEDGTDYLYLCDFDKLSEDDYPVRIQRVSFFLYRATIIEEVVMHKFLGGQDLINGVSVYGERANDVFFDNLPRFLDHMKILQECQFEIQLMDQRVKRSCLEFLRTIPNLEVIRLLTSGNKYLVESTPLFFDENDEPSPVFKNVQLEMEETLKLHNIVPRINMYSSLVPFKFFCYDPTD